MLNSEIDNFWLHGEREYCRRNFIISELKKDWRGRFYKKYTSLPQHNIYRERFDWKEYV